jgi:hypothetical protein
MRYKAYTYDADRQLNPLEDYPFFREDGIFVSRKLKYGRTFGLTSELADGVYKMANFNIYFIPESHPYFNTDVITNAVDGYGQPPITSRKRIHTIWVKFTKLTFTYIKKITK